MNRYIDYTWLSDGPYECPVNHRSAETATRCLRRGLYLDDDDVGWGIVVRFEGDIPREVVALVSNTDV